MFHKIKRWWLKSVANNRLRHGHYPECNSDAPRVDTCCICRGYRGSFPPSEYLKHEWWLRWMLKHDYGIEWTET